MKVGVLPVDSSHPNYALMKVSSYWKSQGAEVEFYTPFAQPYRDFDRNQEPPQWQKDMARWVNRKEIFRTTNFFDYAPRQGFRCSEYFNK